MTLENVMRKLKPVIWSIKYKDGSKQKTAYFKTREGAMKACENGLGTPEPITSIPKNITFEDENE